MLAGIDRRGVLVGAGGLALLSAGSALAAATRPVPPKRLDCRDLTADDATEGWDLSGKLALVTGCNAVQPSELALDDEAAARLWAISEQMVAATST
jgi:hypothetical protein